MVGLQVIGRIHEILGRQITKTRRVVIAGGGPLGGVRSNTVASVAGEMALSKLSMIATLLLWLETRCGAGRRAQNILCGRRWQQFESRKGPQKWACRSLDNQRYLERIKDLEA